MKWLPLLVYVLTAPTLAGIFMVAVLTMRNYSTNMLIGGAAIGFVAALPIAWILAKQLAGKSRA
jgi:hypothetical protein